mgnify:CR=1 FL=1
MRNLENFGVQEMSLSEQKSIDGGGWLSWAAEKIVDALIDIYPKWVENGGAEQTTYGSIGIGLSGNTAFSGM